MCKSEVRYIVCQCWQTEWIFACLFCYLICLFIVLYVCGNTVMTTALDKYTQWNSRNIFKVFLYTCFACFNSACRLCCCVDWKPQGPLFSFQSQAGSTYPQNISVVEPKTLVICQKKHWCYSHFVSLELMQHSALFSFSFTQKRSSSFTKGQVFSEFCIRLGWCFGSVIFRPKWFI